MKFLRYPWRWINLLLHAALAPEFVSHCSSVKTTAPTVPHFPRVS